MNPAPAVEGTCGGCSGGLAAGQRYCLACGQRRGVLPALFRPPERAATPAPRQLPGPTTRSFGAVGAVVLASGMLIGAAVGPTLTPASLASSARQLVLVSEEAAAAPAAAAEGQGAAATSTLSAPTGNVAAPHRTVRSGGAPAPVATPAAASASTPPPASPTPDPPAPDPVPEASPEIPSVAGTVVHVSHEGKVYVLATKEGQLIAVHTDADAPPALGDKLATTVRALDNGTFKERRPTAKGHAGGAKFHATVTFADAEAGTYAASARGVSMLIHLPPGATPPAIGVLTTIDAALRADGTVTEVTREDGDPVAGDLDIEAIVRDPDPAAPERMVVSADDAGESAGTLSLGVPPELDVSKLTPGTVILAIVKREEDGRLTLVSAAEDR